MAAKVPPMMALASGTLASPPISKPRAKGVKPKAAASMVITTGRNRSKAPEIMAS